MFEIEISTPDTESWRHDMPHSSDGLIEYRDGAAVFVGITGEIGSAGFVTCLGPVKGGQYLNFNIIFAKDVAGLGWRSLPEGTVVKISNGRQKIEIEDWEKQSENNFTVLDSATPNDEN